MGDRSSERADGLVGLLNLESRLSAVETLVAVHRGDLKTLNASLTRIETTLHSNATEIKVQQVEFANLVKSLRETAKRNAWTVGIVVAAASVVGQFLIAGMHL